MKCPKCARPTQVKDSRNINRTRRRRRECEKCEYRFTTTEMYGIQQVSDTPLLRPEVIKRNNKFATFDEIKLAKSINDACLGRGLTNNQIDAVFNDVIAKINELDAESITIDKLVELVINELVHCEKLAALKYAIQYIHFKSDDEFMQYSKDLSP